MVQLNAEDVVRSVLLQIGQAADIWNEVCSHVWCVFKVQIVLLIASLWKFLYFTEGIENADLVLLVTTRPTTGNTLAWAVACERDQWGRAIAGIPCTFTCHLLSPLHISGRGF